MKMGMPIIPKIIGIKRSQWFKMIIFGFLMFCFLFEPMYGWFFGKVLIFEFIGLRLLAYVFAGLFFIFAYDAKQTM